MSQPARTDWAVVGMAVLAGITAAAHIGKLPPALPGIRDELGIGLVAGGFVISLFNALGMTLAAFVGGMADRLGRARLVAAGFAALMLGGVLGAGAQGLPLMLASRFVEGVGFISVSVALPAVISAAVAPADRPLALGIWSVYTPAGMALALLAAPLALEAVGWRGMWLGIAALCLPVGLGIRLAMRRVALPPQVPGRFAVMLAESLRRPGLLVLAAIFAAYAFQWVTLMVWLPTFLTDSLGLSLRAAALATALVVLINVPGCLFGGWLMRRGLPARRLILAGSIVMGVTAVGIFLPVLPDAGRIGLCLAFSFFGGLIPPSLFGSVPSQAPTPSHLGAANGMIMQGSSLGQFAGAPLVAATVSLAGGDWRFALIPMLALCAGAVLAGGRLGR